MIENFTSKISLDQACSRASSRIAALSSNYKAIQMTTDVYSSNGTLEYSVAVLFEKI